MIYQIFVSGSAWPTIEKSYICKDLQEICGSCKPTTPTLINWKPAQKNNEEFYAELEVDLLSRINALGLGPQKLGDSTIALTVLIETASYHIASLPVAVNIECHKHRHKTATI